MSKRSHWKVLFKGEVNDGSPRIDGDDYWKHWTAEQKFREVQELCLQALELQGRRVEDVSRLCRTTAVLKRQ